MDFEFSYSEFFSGRFDTSGSMVPHLVPEIEGGYPERDGEEEEEGGEGLVLENSRSWMNHDLNDLSTISKYGINLNILVLLLSTIEHCTKKDRERPRESEFQVS